MSTVISVARKVCIAAHGDQKRKYTSSPYWMHPLAVMNRVADMFPAYTVDKEVLAAALLHDVVEDTHFTTSDIIFMFGTDVGTLVHELTDRYTKEDYPRINRAERKEHEAIRIGNVSYWAKVIKMADIWHNTKDIEEHDPEFAKVYLQEKDYMLGKIMTPDFLKWLGKQGYKGDE